MHDDREPNLAFVGKYKLSTNDADFYVSIERQCSIASRIFASLFDFCNLPFRAGFLNSWEERIMKRIAVISAILEDPENAQADFNALIAGFKGLIKGRMGLPMSEFGVTVVVITLVGDMDEINSLTGKIGKIPGIQVKTSISKKEV